jgi:hypothetical protein
MRYRLQRREGVAERMPAKLLTLSLFAMPRTTSAGRATWYRD